MDKAERAAALKAKFDNPVKVEPMDENEVRELLEAAGSRADSVLRILIKAGHVKAPEGGNDSQPERPEAETESASEDDTDAATETEVSAETEEPEQG